MKTPFTSKVCPDCGIEKLRSEYYKKGDTVSFRCKPCTNAKNKANASKYFGKYSEYANEWRRNKVANSPEYVAHRNECRRKNYAIKKDVINAARREDWANNPYCSARLYHRRKDVKDKTPKWADRLAILEIYAKCPKGFHVDHIIPLRGLIDGRPVSGLHVHYNLQYLTPEENLSKKNKITESYLATIK